MAEKKYQIFISSTYRDLVDERRDITRAVLDLGHIPAAMEHFPAMDEEQLDYIKRVIDECDYYVLVIAGKYGSVNVDGISYTELEYDYAVSSGKTVLGFPIQDWTKLPQNMTEADETTRKKLEAFRQKLMGGRLVRQWQTRSDLELAVVKGLNAAFQRFPQEGWVRTPKNSNEDLLEKIVELQNENEHLKANQNQSCGKITDLENFASLDENFGFEVNIIDRLGKSNKAGSGFFVEIRWCEIFLYFALAIGKNVHHSIFRKTFLEIVKEHNLGEIVKLSEAVYCSDMTYSRIIAHLQVLGLIQIANSSAPSLTEAGSIEYLRRMAMEKR